MQPELHSSFADERLRDDHGVRPEVDAPSGTGDGYSTGRRATVMPRPRPRQTARPDRRRGGSRGSASRALAAVKPEPARGSSVACSTPRVELVEPALGLLGARALPL